MQPKFFFRFGLYLVISFAFFSSNVFAEFLSVKTKSLILFEGPSSSTKKKFIVTEGYPLKVVVSLKDIPGSNTKDPAFSNPTDTP